MANHALPQTAEGSEDAGNQTYENDDALVMRRRGCACFMTFSREEYGYSLCSEHEAERERLNRAAPSGFHFGAGLSGDWQFPPKKGNRSNAERRDNLISLKGWLLGFEHRAQEGGWDLSWFQEVRGTLDDAANHYAHLSDKEEPRRD